MTFHTPLKDPTERHEAIEDHGHADGSSSDQVPVKRTLKADGLMKKYSSKLTWLQYAARRNNKKKPAHLAHGA